MYDKNILEGHFEVVYLNKCIFFTLMLIILLFYNKLFYVDVSTVKTRFKLYAFWVYSASCVFWLIFNSFLNCNVKLTHLICFPDSHVFLSPLPWKVRGFTIFIEFEFLNTIQFQKVRRVLLKFVNLMDINMKQFLKKDIMAGIQENICAV